MILFVMVWAVVGAIMLLNNPGESPARKALLHLPPGQALLGELQCNHPPRVFEIVSTLLDEGYIGRIGTPAPGGVSCFPIVKPLNLPIGAGEVPVLVKDLCAADPDGSPKSDQALWAGGSHNRFRDLGLYGPHSASVPTLSVSLDGATRSQLDLVFATGLGAHANSRLAIGQGAKPSVWNLSCTTRETAASHSGG